MLLFQFLLFCFAVVVSSRTDSDVVLTGSQSETSTEAFPTGTYPDQSTITLSSDTSFGTITSYDIVMGTANTTSISMTQDSRTQLTGGLLPTTSTLTGTANGNSSSTASSTGSSVQPTNTSPCNGYPEFCNRKYSNITNVMAHNSQFIGTSAADNQALPVMTQLNDGIRGLQIQAHILNGTVYLCHTSCDILNAGRLTDYLTTVTIWLQSHPYDVITILIGNGDYSPVKAFVPAIEASGITQYVYQPPIEPMGLDDWPTLGSMILSGKRVVIFMDYNADETEVPWILVEFSQMWETPFDPTDRNFPCTQQRPPGLTAEQQNDRLYVMNHNLNQNLSLLGISLSVPNIPYLPQTNNVSGFGSLGQAAENCVTDWNRPPTFMSVDFYNNGSGTVFEVAATWNNVTYTGICCGMVKSGSERTLTILDKPSSLMMAFLLFSAWMTM